MKKMLFAGMLIFGAMTMMANAQMGGMAMPAPGTQVEPAKALEMIVGNFESEFTGAAKAMPADKYSFAPTTAMFAGSKYDGVRTFAQQITHVIQANYSYAMAASGLKTDTDVKAIVNLNSKDEVLAALAASFVFVHKAIATITPQNAFEAVRGGTRATLAEGIAVHGFDHYGQMVEYLRMNGIIPPASAM